MNKRIKLYCFPFAGGSAVIFNPLRKLLYEFVDVVPVEYAGRGKRFKEHCYADMKAAVNDMYNLLKHQLNSSPYALLGYSFGSLLAYELIKKICTEADQLPMHAFFMASHAPHNRYGDYNFHKLSDENLTEVLTRLGGIPEGLADNKELLNIFIPIIKNDFKVYENYDLTLQKVKLPMSYTVLNAAKDMLITPEKTQEWDQYSGCGCNIKYVDSDHFFIVDKPEEMASIVKSALLPVNISTE